MLVVADSSSNHSVLIMQEVIAFQVDQSADVRKFIVAFMEDAWCVCVCSLCTLYM